MELADIEAFLAVADELHFGRAAGRMHVSTARVSQRIRALEREVGARLVERTSRRVALSPLGVRLRGQFQPAYEELLTAMRTARTEARSTTGYLRVGVTATSDGPATQQLISRFAARHPDCSVVACEVDSPQCALRSGEVDVLIDRPVDSMPGFTFVNAAVAVIWCTGRDNAKVRALAEIAAAT